MRGFIKYFSCGQIYKDRETLKFIVTKIDDIINIIIPFFTQNHLEGLKAKDFADFSKVAEMVKKKKGTFNKRRIR